MPVRFDDFFLFFDEANTPWLLSAVGMKTSASMSTLMSFWAVVVFTLSIGCFTTKDVLARMTTTKERRQKISKKLAKMILVSSPSVNIFLRSKPVTKDKKSHKGKGNKGKGKGGAPTTPAPTPTPTPPPKQKPKNILFLIADDLRPQLNKAYGKTFMHTPHLDQFTDTALVFDWAYTNHGICGASRNSFLSGRVPDKTRYVPFHIVVLFRYTRNKGIEGDLQHHIPPNPHSHLESLSLLFFIIVAVFFQGVEFPQ